MARCAKCAVGRSALAGGPFGAGNVGGGSFGVGVLLGFGGGNGIVTCRGGGWPENCWLMRGSPPQPEANGHTVGGWEVGGRALGAYGRAGLALLTAASMALALSSCGGAGHASAAAVTSTTATTGVATGGDGTGTSTASRQNGTGGAGSGSGSGSAGGKASTGPAGTGSSGTGAAGAGATSNANGGSNSSKGTGTQGSRHTGGTGGQKSTGGSHGTKGTKNANPTKGATGSGAPPGTGAGSGAGGSSGAGSNETAASQYTYEVRSLNMEPTFKPYTKVYYDPSDTTPTADQVVVFHLPAGAMEGSCGDNPPPGHACQEAAAGLSSTVTLGRVVAVGGDAVAFQEGNVIRNGRSQAESFTEPCGSGPVCTFSDPITVPGGSYYIVYDNRSQLDDSRVWGAVPQAAIVGVVNGVVASS
jgi:signal peptidase I